MKSIVIVCALCLSGNADGANLIVNPSFESGDFSGWTVGGNSKGFGVDLDGTLIQGADPLFGPTFVNVRTGDYAAFALVRTRPTSESLILSQSIVVTAGTEYEVGYHLGIDAQLRTSADYFNVIRIDGVLVGNTVTDSDDAVLLPGSENSDLFYVTGTYVAASTGPASVSFTLNGSGSARAGISYDDFFFRPVPEPSSLAMLYASVLGCITRRRVR